MMYFKKKKNDDSRKISQFIETGFHGDIYLQQIVNFLIKECMYFIETGTNVGSTLAYVAKTYPEVSCLSCEPHVESYLEAKKNISKYLNAVVFNKNSDDFIENVKQKNVSDNMVIFWLDAHGYGFDWPLIREIEYITNNFKKAYILIDDFKVPNNKEFKWDKYNEQECSFEFIKHAIRSDCEFTLYYPAYNEKTSIVHPLTGWGLISIGKDEVEFPDEIKKLIEKDIKNYV